MDCNTFRKNLSSFLEDILDDSQYRLFIQHLEQCTLCDHHIKAFGSFSGIFRDLNYPLKEDFTPQILAALKNQTKPKKSLFPVLLIGILFFMLGAFFYHLRQRQTIMEMPSPVKENFLSHLPALKKSPPKGVGKDISPRSEASKAREKEELEKIMRQVQDEKKAFRESLLKHLQELAKTQKSAAEKGQAFGVSEMEAWMNLQNKVQDQKDGVLSVDLSNGTSHAAIPPPPASKAAPTPIEDDFGDSDTAPEESISEKISADKSSGQFHWHLNFVDNATRYRIRNTLLTYSTSTPYNTRELIILKIQPERFQEFLKATEMLPSLNQALKRRFSGDLSGQKKPITLSLWMQSAERETKPVE